MRYLSTLVVLVILAIAGGSRADSPIEFAGRVKGPVIRSSNGAITAAVVLPEITNVSDFPISRLVMEVWISKSPFSKKLKTKSQPKRILWAGKMTFASYESMEPQKHKNPNPILLGTNEKTVGTHHSVLVISGYINNKKVLLYRKNGKPFKVTKHVRSKRKKTRDSGYSIL
jgi:hypothetical protein